MLFLKNIPTSRKVILRSLLDTENAAMMNHPVLQYTCIEFLSEPDVQRLELWMNTQYFLYRNGIDNIDANISMFRQWSMKHFISLYQMLHVINNISENETAWWIGRHNFLSLISKLSFPTIPMMEYIISRGIDIKYELYAHVIYSNNMTHFKWLEEQIPIFRENRIHDGLEWVVGSVTYRMVMNYRPDMFRYLVEKYGENAEHLEFLKKQLRKFRRLFEDNNMVGFIELSQELDIM